MCWPRRRPDIPFVAHASTVGVAQGLERRTVAPEAAGSIPVTHPTSLNVHPKNRRVALLVALAVSLASSCRETVPARATGDSRPADVVATASHAEDRDRSTRCDEQAGLVAASTMRREDRKRPPRWEAHYSEKYDQCYVRIDRIVDNAGAPAVVSELWEAFEAALLAVHSADGGDTTTRSFCQVSLSDDPFTSCMVSKFFIEEHMQH